MNFSSKDLRRPLLSKPYSRSSRSNDDDDDDEEALILEEWNASVSAFVAHDGGEENASCYCPSIDEVLAEDGDEEANENENANVSGNNQNEEIPHDSGLCWDSLKALCRKMPWFFRSTLFPDSELTLGSYCVDRNGSSSSTTTTTTSTSSRENENDEEETFHRRPRRFVDGTEVVKFVKFVLLTLGSIALVRFIVVKDFPDHDRYLRLWQIFLYEGDSILRDLCVFFVVGRMHQPQRTGVDCLEWIFFALVANVYFECQGYIPWMQHAVTLYEMHCVWPWQLWVFAGLVVLVSVGVALAHVVIANRRGIAWIKLGELLASVGVFLIPVATSPYFHFHHWFAGWLFGMHANLHDRWWSRAAMAYCWGMYVNGIAVYGRDPLLTCDYARFLVEDQNCPTTMDEDSAEPHHFGAGGIASLVADLFRSGTRVSFLLLVGKNDGVISDDHWQPADWKNCSSSGYHP